MKIGIDIMGGDNAKKVTTKGAILALKELPPSDKIVLIGDSDIIISSLKENNYYSDAFEIVHASEVIEMEEHPTKAFMQKTDSSMVVGFKLLKEKKIDSFASAGNSGAMLVGSMYSVSPVPGIIRPCITSIIPKEDGSVGILLDVGINPDCKPDIMYQFAILGSIFAKNVYNIENPKVALLNIGTEEDKGNLLCQATYKLMKNSSDFNFVGNVEGRDFFKDKSDVIVCDGFTGNIILKQSESIYRIIVKRNLADDYFKRYNYENYGGTPILGIDSTVILGHGISNEKAIKNMLLLSKHVYEAKLCDKIRQAFEAHQISNSNSKSNSIHHSEMVK